MTPQEIQILRTALLADTDPAVQQAVATRNDTEVARLYNLNAVPDYWAWRTLMSRNEAQAQGFDWTQCDNLSNGQARIWEWLFNSSGQCNPSEEGVRSGISECWKGTAQKVAVATFVLSKSRRLATKAEKLYAVGAGTTVAPSLFGFQGAITVNDVGQALNG